MLDVNLIMAKTEAKCRGRVCLRKLSWTGYVCKHALFRLTDQFTFLFLCCGRQTSLFKSIIISWPKIEKQRVSLTYDTCVWTGVTPTRTILTINQNKFKKWRWFQMKYAHITQSLLKSQKQTPCWIQRAMAQLPTMKYRRKSHCCLTLTFVVN